MSEQPLLSSCLGGKTRAWQPVYRNKLSLQLTLLTGTAEGGHLKAGKGTKIGCAPEFHHNYVPVDSKSTGRVVLQRRESGNME